MACPASTVFLAALAVSMGVSFVAVAVYLVVKYG
jgi:hypothetical protein